MSELTTLEIPQDILDSLNGARAATCSAPARVGYFRGLEERMATRLTGFAAIELAERIDARLSKHAEPGAAERQPLDRRKHVQRARKGRGHG